MADSTEERSFFSEANIITGALIATGAAGVIFDVIVFRGDLAKLTDSDFSSLSLLVSGLLLSIGLLRVSWPHVGAVEQLVAFARSRSPWLFVPLALGCGAAIAGLNWFVWSVFYFAAGHPGYGGGYVLIGLLFAEPFIAAVLIVAAIGLVYALQTGREEWLSSPSPPDSTGKSTMVWSWTRPLALVSFLHLCAWVVFVVVYSSTRPSEAEPLLAHPYMLMYWGLYPLLGIAGLVLAVCLEMIGRKVPAPDAR